MPNAPIRYSVDVKSVEVSIDKVLDSDIAKQIASICDSYFSDLNNENILSLAVFITQRSFFYQISQKNSIFVNYTLTDSSDKIIMQKGFSYETKATIVSGKEQYKIARKIKKNVNAFLKKAQGIKAK